MNKRINKMTNEEIDYHFHWVGDDPPLSFNVFRVMLLICRWFKGMITPREFDELINSLYYARQKMNGWMR